MLDLDRVRGQVPFKREGWRRIAFWWAVLLAGVVLGTRWAHPGLPLLEFLHTPTAPSEPLASQVSGAFTFIALLLLTVVIGHEKLIGGPGED